MNRSHLRALWVSMVMLLSGFVVTNWASANLVVNGGFELGPPLGGTPVGHGDLPTPWTSSAPLNFLISYDTWENTGTTGVPPNFASLFTGVVAPEGVRWAGGFDFEELGQLLQTPLTPGQEYTFSAYVRSAM